MGVVSFNSDLFNKLGEDSSIDIEEAKMYLLCVYHRLDASRLNLNMLQVNKINSFGIFEAIMKKDYTEIKWHIPLFEEEKTDAFSWVAQWRKPFVEINPSRSSDNVTVTKRMVKFFAENPEVRVDDVFRARDKYLESVSSPQYLKNAGKFVYEGAGFSRTSLLAQYVEIVKGSNSKDGRSSKMI